MRGIMTDVIHQDIIGAVQLELVRCHHGGDQVTDWMKVLRTVHGDLSRQSSRVLNGTMFESLRNFREHKSFDQWASSWRVKQFSDSGRMMVDSTTGLPTFLFNDSPITRDPGWFVGILEDNPAFSTSHDEMLLKYEKYKKNLSGDLDGGSPELEDPTELSESTSCFINNFKLLIGEVYDGSVLFENLNGLPLRTFLEYLVFLIEETNYTVPISLNLESERRSGWEKYNKWTKRFMAEVDWSKTFNDERNIIIRTEIAELKLGQYFALASTKTISLIKI